MSSNFAFGQAGPADMQNKYTSTAFLVDMFIARVRTAMLVQVKSCSNSGGVSAVGTVSVQPMVNMIDGQGNSTPHGEVFNLPYFRLQGGANGAVIIDPVPGDIGVAVICDRDSSAVQSTKAVANPGTYRTHDIADGLYLGGFLNAVPNAYVQFDGQGNVNIVDNNGNQIQMASGGITITGNVKVNGSIQATGDVQGGSISLENHVHTGVTSGSSNTGPATG